MRTIILSDRQTGKSEKALLDFCSSDNAVLVVHNEEAKEYVLRGNPNIRRIDSLGKEKDLIGRNIVLSANKMTIENFGSLEMLGSPNATLILDEFFYFKERHAARIIDFFAKRPGLNVKIYSSIEPGDVLAINKHETIKFLVSKMGFQFLKYRFTDITAILPNKWAVTGYEQ